MTNIGYGRTGSVVIAVCAFAGTLLTVSCSALMEADPAEECTAEDTRFAETLNDLPVLELRPDGATLIDQGPSYGCTESTYYSFAGRTYRPVGTVEDVADFYLGAAPAAGWKLESAGDIRSDQRVFLGEKLCFSSSVEGVTAALAIGFPGNPDDGPEDVLGHEPRNFSLHVAADIEGPNRAELLC